MYRVVVLIICALATMAALEQNGSAELYHLRLRPSVRPKLARPQCPRSHLEIEKLVISDTASFQRKYPSGTWATFVHVFKFRYANCPSFVKRVYLKAARDILEPPQQKRWGR